MVSGLYRLIRDRRGTISLIAGFSAVLLMACAAVTVDVGRLFTQRTQLQGADDAAALAATGDFSQARAIAQRAVQGYGFSADTVQDVILGSYCPDGNIAPQARFTPGNQALNCKVPTGPLPNAVRVDSKAAMQLSFLHLFDSHPTLPTSTTSTAARIDLAALRAGTGVAELDNGLVNGLLSALLRTNVSLDLVSYKGLVGANITALDFLDALALQLGVRVGSYSQLADVKVTLPTVLTAAVSALAKEGGSVAAMAGLQSIQNVANNGVNFSLASLLDLNVFKSIEISSNPPTALKAMLNVFDILNFALQLASPTNTLGLDVGLTLPGLGGLSIDALAIEPPQPAYFEFGPVGTTVHTAQVRLQIHLSLAVPLLPGIPLVGLNVPLYLELGSGDATISNISCGAQPKIDQTVTVQAQTGIVRVWLGTVSTNQISNFTKIITAADVTPATLVSVAGLISIQGVAMLSVGTSDPIALVFNAQQIQNGTMQTVGSNAILGSLLSTLLGNTQLTVNVLGLGLGITLSFLQDTVMALLKVLPLDGLVNLLLNILGLRLGYMDVWVPAARCGVPVLVQ